MGVVEPLWQGANRGHPGPLQPEVARREEGHTEGDAFFRYLLNAYCTPEGRREKLLPHLLLPSHTANFPSVGNQSFRPVLSVQCTLCICQQ